MSIASECDTFQAQTDKESEGEISDAEAQEKNEEMNYLETVRAVRALGWTHIPDFESSTSDVDQSDNLQSQEKCW